VTLAGTYTFPSDVVFATTVRAHSALPYNVFSGVDLNHNGFVVNLPAGVSNVNSGRGTKFAQLDLRVSKLFHMSGAAGVEGIAEVFNIFNAINPAGFNGNLSSASFGQPSTFAGDPLQGEQRLAQLGLRFRF
jgi:hypothetical protein